MRLVVTFFISLIPFLLWAQNYTITGKIMDEVTGNPLEYATVSVLKADDSALVSGGITDPSGSFKINVEAGSYFLRVQFVTYEAQEIRDIQVGPSNRTAAIGVVMLAPSEQELDEVVVQAERTQMELQLDKKVYNVGKDLSNLGGSASDMLDNLPSVSVDVEGNVSLRGSTNVRILIDGKPSGLVGLSSTDALRQLQGNLIERVEIITNPSARYDAEGMAGIINIILKKEGQKGVNGSFQVNTGYPQNHGASVNMNLRRKWVNFFINYGVSYRSNPGGGGGLQYFTFPDSSAIRDRQREHVRSGLANNVRFGADFFLGEKSTLTTSFLYRYSDEVNVADLYYIDYDNQQNLLAFTHRNDEESEGDENLEYAVNYTKEFSNEDHKLTADIQYQNNNELEQSDIVQLYGPNRSELAPQLYQKVRNDEGEERWMFQSDYIHPFSSKGKVEAGFRSTIRQIKNIYTLSESEDDTEYEILEDYSTDFAYNEMVHAAYSIVGNELERFSWQVGLRAEMTDIHTIFGEEEDGRDGQWNYTNYFPSAFLTYKLVSQNQLQASYSRRINRPRFRDLNPFSNFTDPQNLRVGNPELQPEFTDSYEVGFLQNYTGASIYYGLYFRHTTDLIQRVNLEPDAEGVRLTVPENIGFSDAVGIEMNASNEFTDWYRVTGNVNFYRQETVGNIGDSINLGATAVTVSTRINNNFKFNNLFDAQLNVNYRAPENRPQGRRLSVTTLDVGLSKDIWNKNGTISLNVQDVFNSRKWRFITELENFYEEAEWQWRRGPAVNLSLVYRLNQKKQRNGQREGGDFNEDNGF